MYNFFFILFINIKKYMLNMLYTFVSNFILIKKSMKKIM